MKKWGGVCLRGTAGGAFVLLLVSACGGGNYSPDGGGGTPPSVTLSEIQDAVFTNKCGGCHGPSGEGLSGTEPPPGVDSIALDFSTKDKSYDGLVGLSGRLSVQSGCPPLLSCGFRVVPGDPDFSYLIRKLENTDISPGTTQMPKGGASLTPGEIGLIRDWIANGAKND